MDLLLVKVIDFRVPIMNDLYINKFGLIQRCKEQSYSKNARSRLIIKEAYSDKTINGLIQQAKQKQTQTNNKGTKTKWQKHYQ